LIRFHQIEFHDHPLALFELAGTLGDSLFDRLDAARAPHLDGRCLPIGTLNFVKVHDADDLFGFVLDFLVAMRHKLG
jgi:hypothetical protein